MKKIFNVNISQISIAALLLSFGIISDVYIRIGNTTFITTSIYIILGLILPISLGITTALLLDTLQLVFRGLIGYWYWSLQIEPVIIVSVAFSLRFLFTIVKDKNILMFISLFFILSIIIGGITIFIIQSDQFSFDYLIHNGKKESDSKHASRLITKYISIFGFILVVLFFIYELINFIRNKRTNTKIASVIIIICTSLLIDWIYHPWATYNWAVNQIGLERSVEVFRTYVALGIWKSMLHIGIGIPLITSAYIASQNILISSKNKY